jgi:hypothetical protein
MRWHYTVGVLMRLIFRDGFIKPATAFVQPPEKPITWFTSSPSWEETANKGVVGSDGTNRSLSREETEKYGDGLYRIGISDDYPLRRFMRITRESKQDLALARALIKTAQELGSNPYQDWWGTFQKVTSGHWKVIEHFTLDGWQPINPEEIAALIPKEIKELNSRDEADVLYPTFLK